jgi:hypothetical protein
MTHSEVKSMGILNLLKRKRQSKDKEVILQESDVERRVCLIRSPVPGRRRREAPP